MDVRTDRQAVQDIANETRVRTGTPQFFLASVMDGKNVLVYMSEQPVVRLDMTM